MSKKKSRIDFGINDTRLSTSAHRIDIWSKIIGAKIYKAGGFFSDDDPKSVRDIDGHGTHVASTAAENPVSMLGLGREHQEVPRQKHALLYGVDIITVSLGGFNDENFFIDVIAIGAFHAMKNGVLTVISAGNDGPRSSSLSNFSPWSITVAASTIYDYICTLSSLKPHNWAALQHKLQSNPEPCNNSRKKCFDNSKEGCYVLFLLKVQ
ncbi:hypothetical protein JHK87_000697 [Glycine soja]|nr:hypothetical protein JHK87_000697 [Glycine soja]